MNAARAAELGVTQIEHHYGYPASAPGGNAPRFSPDYNYSDEAHRFRYAGPALKP